MEQLSRRALHKSFRSENPGTIACESFPPNTAIYFYKKKGNGGGWDKGKALFTESDIVQIWTNDKYKCKPVQIAYEDINVIPD